MKKLNILALVFTTGSKAINVGGPEKSSNILAQLSSTCGTSLMEGFYGGTGPFGCYGNTCGGALGGWSGRPNSNYYCQGCDRRRNFCQGPCIQKGPTVCCCNDRKNVSRRINDVEIAPETCNINVDTSSFGGNFCKEFNVRNIKANKDCCTNNFNKYKEDVAYAGCGK